MDVFDALFARGQQAHLEALRSGMDGEEPGLPALGAGLDAACRWAFANPALAQLLFWRPVPSFEPTAEAMAPSVEMVRLQRQALADAAAAGQLGPGADSDEALYVVSVFVSGVLGQAMANEPDVRWGKGRFTPLLPKLLDVLTAMYPPTRWPPRPLRRRGDRRCHTASLGSKALGSRRLAPPAPSVDRSTTGDDHGQR